MENVAAQMPPIDERRHTPSLSGSQKAYLFRKEAFLDGIDERAKALFADGYEVRETALPHVFLVLCPEVRGMRNAYRVNPVDVTCTCPFFACQSAGQPLDVCPVACKHLVGLPRLVHASFRVSIRQRKLGRFYRLWSRWHSALQAQPALDELWGTLGPLTADALPALTKGETHDSNHENGTDELA